MLDLSDEEELKKLKKFFVEKPKIVFVACSTGKDQHSIGALFSRTLNARAFAPKEPSSVEEYRLKESGELENVKYNKKSNEFLEGIPLKVAE